MSQNYVYLPHNFVHTGTTSPRLRLRSPLTAFTGLKFIASVYLKNISLQRFCWTHIISFFVIQFSFFSLLKSTKLWMFWCSSCFVKVYLVLHKRNTTLTRFSYWLELMLKLRVFQTFVQRVAFRTTLYFEIHQHCNFREQFGINIWHRAYGISIQYGGGNGCGLTFSLDL